MTGYGISHGAVSVMNAIPCGIGSTIGIDLRTEATYEPAESTDIELVGRPELSTDLVRTCVRNTLEVIGIEPEPYRLKVECAVPPSMGLKSSSAVCNAVISAVLDHYGARRDPVDIVRLGTVCAKECGVTITGAFDDACGCYFGGLVITDNRTNEILLSKEIPKYDVIICLPKRSILKSKVPVDRYRVLKGEYESMVPLIENGYLEVMSRNGKHIESIIGKDNDIVERAMAAGALSAGITGTGPAIAIIAEPGSGKRISEELGCECILTRTR